MSPKQTQSKAQITLLPTLKPVLFLALNKIIELLIKTDQIPKTYLTELNNKAVKIIITDLSLESTLIIANEKLYLSDKNNENVDTTLSMDVHCLFELFRQRHSSTPANVNLEICGNIAVGQLFKQMLDDVDIDPEEILASFIGDVLAYRIGSTTRSTIAWFSSNFDNLSQSSADFLIEEQKAIAHPLEINQFVSDTDSIRQSVDRLEARLKRLRSALNEST